MLKIGGRDLQGLQKATTNPAQKDRKPSSRKEERDAIVNGRTVFGRPNKGRTFFGRMLFGRPVIGGLASPLQVRKLEDLLT